MVKNLRKLRKEKGITQKELAKLVGLSQQSINKYENTASEPDIKNLIALADFFDTSVDYLVGNSEIRHKIEEVTEYTMNNAEIKVMENYRGLDNNVRDLFSQTLAALNIKRS